MTIGGGPLVLRGQLTSSVASRTYSTAPGARLV